MPSVADRIKETTTTTGTGTVSLGGAQAGFRAFSSAFTTGTVVYYCITDGTNWEVGSGAVTTGTPWTLARTSILASSNANALVSFGAGSKDVFCTLPADQSAKDQTYNSLGVGTPADGVAGDAIISNKLAVGGAAGFILAPYTLVGGVAGYGYMWSAGVTPTGSNYALASNSVNTFLLGTTSVSLAVGTSQLSVTASASTFMGTITAGQMNQGAYPFVAGSIGYSAGQGLIIAAKAGTGNDLSIINPANNAYLATVATGTTNWTFPGSVASPNFIGNSSTTTILQTARLISGVSFNGSADVDLVGTPYYEVVTGQTYTKYGPSLTDYNLNIQAGHYNMQPGINGPAGLGANWGFLYVSRHVNVASGSVYVQQICCDMNGTLPGAMWCRRGLPSTGYTATWSPWLRIITDDGSGNVSVTGTFSTTGNIIQGVGTATEHMVINGDNSLSAGGVYLGIQNAGVGVMYLGNYSAIMGGAYNSQPMLYTTAPLNISGGFVVGLSSLDTVGDFHAVRSGGTTGVIYFGNSGARYLYYDGTNYIMPGTKLFVNSSEVVTLATDPNTTVYTAATTPLPALGTSYQVAHGLGVTPAFADLELTNINAEYGWVTGDVQVIRGIWNGTTDTAASVWKNATNVGLVVPSGYVVVGWNKTSGLHTTLTPANWSYRFALRKT